jgi:hypothetical protein
MGKTAILIKRQHRHFLKRKKTLACMKIVEIKNIYVLVVFIYNHFSPCTCIVINYYTVCKKVLLLLNLYKFTYALKSV